MRIIKPAALAAALLLGALLCADAWAQEPTPAQTHAPAASASASAEAYAKLPVCTLSADRKRLAVEPCRTAPPPVPMPRRSVTQIIQPMPKVTRAPQVGMPAMPPSTPIETLMHPPGAPTPAASCDAGGCFGPGGTRYNGAAGGAVLTPSGKLCNRSGAWIQC